LKKDFFKLIRLTVVNIREDGDRSDCEASIQVDIGGHVEHTASGGVGPVNAIDLALRKALISYYPELENFKLKDYKVEIAGNIGGTEAEVFVQIVSGTEKEWITYGRSENVLDASWDALATGVKNFLKEIGGE